MKLAILSASIGAACAFAPSNNFVQQTSLRMSTTESETAQEETYAVLSEPSDGVTAVGDSSPAAAIEINGWTADESLPCYGLPGALAPTGFFDPLGFAQNGISLNEVKRNREAEVMHGRVA